MAVFVDHQLPLSGSDNYFIGVCSAIFFSSSFIIDFFDVFDIHTVAYSKNLWQQPLGGCPRLPLVEDDTKTTKTVVYSSSWV